MSTHEPATTKNRAEQSEERIPIITLVETRAVSVRLREWFEPLTRRFAGRKGTRTPD